MTVGQELDELRAEVKRWRREEEHRASDCCGQEERAEKAEAEVERIRMAASCAVADLEKIGALCSLKEYEYPLAAVERVVAERAELEHKLAEALAEVEEYSQLNTRLGALLTSVADALKGKPDSLTLHGWSDLPERSEYAVRCGAEAIAKAVELERKLSELKRLAADALHLIESSGSGSSIRTKLEMWFEEHGGDEL
jgi:hypothetical protein